MFPLCLNGSWGKKKMILVAIFIVGAWIGHGRGNGAWWGLRRGVGGVSVISNKEGETKERKNVGQSTIQRRTPIISRVFPFPLELFFFFKLTARKTFPFPFFCHFCGLFLSKIELIVCVYDLYCLWILVLNAYAYFRHHVLLFGIVFDYHITPEVLSLSLVLRIQFLRVRWIAISNSSLFFTWDEELLANVSSQGTVRLGVSPALRLPAAPTLVFSRGAGRTLQLTRCYIQVHGFDA